MRAATHGHVLENGIKNPARCGSRRGEEDREAVRVRMVDRGGQLIGQSLCGSVGP